MIHVERTSNRWIGARLLIAHVWRNGVVDTLSANLDEGTVEWRFDGTVAVCESEAATEAAFRLMLVGIP